jgi:hypothetical protein
MKEAIIKTTFGEVRLTFQSTEELDAALQDLQPQIERIRASTAAIIPSLPRIPKAGYESHFQFTPSGSLELLKLPKKQNEAVALALFAFHPDTLASEDLERILGIDDVARRVLAQKAHVALSVKVDDKYGLTFAGIQMVQDKFGPAQAAAEED